MNKYEIDILNEISKNNDITQRVLSEVTGFSLGMINKTINVLKNLGYLSESMTLTPKGKLVLSKNKPSNAIILAAGYGTRMIPINYDIPKGLVEVKGEVMIERLIRQLKAAGIYSIYVVVGYMKEKFEYLIDQYDVELIVNTEYAEKNNLHSLYLASKYISDTYIVPCDIWFDNNPFKTEELYSWYMVSDKKDKASTVKEGKNKELIAVPDNKEGNRMVGLAYIAASEASDIAGILKKCDKENKYNNEFWEEILFVKDNLSIQACVIKDDDYYEINTYEQLRDIDEESNHLKSEVMDILKDVFKVSANDIKNIKALKKGMTNRSFSFTVDEQKYIMRIPGEGTEKLINRQEEAEVYKVIGDINISDEIIYINPNNGYKITKYYKDVSVCDCENITDVEKCLGRLREFHNKELKVGHTFDVWKQIEFYESLWNGSTSVYKDYKDTKDKVLSLKNYISNNTERWCLSHIDSVPDNFLMLNNDEIRLIDWEYAGMQDPDIDIAMFCIYSFYDKDMIDRTIDIYYQGQCKENIRTKIYAYVSVCGLLWSNWCEYKRMLGIEFGEYSLKQYRYAKTFYKCASERIKVEGL